MIDRYSNESKQRSSNPGAFSYTACKTGVAAYRFRLKFGPDPTSLWRDVVVGSDRALDEFQTTINAAMGLGQGHRWFIGTDEDYWNSDVKYQCPQEFEGVPSGEPMGFGEKTHNTGETTVVEMIQRLGLDERDRICYLYDYGDEWRFDAILKDVVDDGSSERSPEIVEENGDGIEQYGPGR